MITGIILRDLGGEAYVQLALMISQNIDEVRGLIHWQGWEIDLNMAPRAGLEPATKRLTAAHSTIELPGN